MIGFLHHLLMPHESNNHRPRVLHHSSLLFVIALLLIGNLLITSVSKSRPDVLGITANITAQELLDLTNQKRKELGLAPLTMSNELSSAASAKGQDMLAKNYWAHNSPEGVTPWVFIKSAGYEYIYAGENLARGFTTAQEVVDAWMASPGHRENMLSPNYKEIGFAIMTGTLTGDETVLVVETFGSRNTTNPKATEIAAAQDIIVVPTQSPAAGTLISPTPSPMTVVPTMASIGNPEANFVAAVQTEPLINKKSFTRNVPMLIVTFFILILALDMFIIERRRIDRLVGHNVDHVIFLTTLLVAVFVLGKGLIL